MTISIESLIADLCAIIDLCDAANPRDTVDDILELCLERTKEYDLEKSREEFMEA